MNDVDRAAVGTPLGVAGMMDWIALLRPSQWLKNLLVFAALIFSLHLFVAQSVVRALVAFASFCLLASASYAVNDVHDAEKDRLHPIKRLRPIAANRISAQSALALAAVLAAAGLALALGLGA